MYKTSNYNYIVECESKVILYNSLSNTPFVFLNDEFTKIQELLIDLSTFEELYKGIFDSFVKGGFIVDSDFSELEYIKIQNKRKIYSDSGYHITINPTLDCNVQCWYCIVKEEKAEYKNTIMSSNTVEKVKKLLYNKIINENVKSLHLAWFGGEPTMYYQDVVKPICMYLESLKIKRPVSIENSITTNASLLSIEMLKEMQEYNFKSFQIPIDGNRRKHDSVKHMKGLGTYDSVMMNIHNIRKFLPNSHITIRINYDRQTLKNIEDIIKDLPEPSKYISLDFQRVWQIPLKADEYELLLEAKKRFADLGYPSSYWAYVPCRFYRCYADKYNYFVINYDGNIFKCAARDYSQESKLGHINDDGYILENKQMISQMYSKCTFENKKCMECKHLPLCFGPCIQKNYERSLVGEEPECIFSSTEMSINSFIIERTKEMNLL